MQKCIKSNEIDGTEIALGDYFELNTKWIYGLFNRDDWLFSYLIVFVF